MLHDTAPTANGYIEGVILFQLREHLNKIIREKQLIPNGFKSWALLRRSKTLVIELLRADRLQTTCPPRASPFSHMSLRPTQELQSNPHFNATYMPLYSINNLS
jgi:hypothetical protein